MPHTTPSPYRFVSGQQRKASPTKQAKTTSVPPQFVPGDAFAPATTNTQQAASPSQFASTPRFSVAQPKPRATPSRPPSPPKPALLNALRAIGGQREDVVDASPEGHEEMLDVERAQALLTTEDCQTEDSEWTNDLPYSPKRRRLEDQRRNGDLATSSSPARPGFRHPQTPASQLPKAVPRFAPPQSSHGSSIAEVITQHRPPFLRPSVAAQEPAEPLPEAFSPHRRGQKFVPGGMAATAQQWVIETGQAAVQSRRGQAYLRGEEVVMRVKVEDVEGDGPFMACARTANGEAMHVLLTRNASTSSSRVTRVKNGDVIGIRAPTWEVQIDGRSWTVGVDWAVCHDR